MVDRKELDEIIIKNDTNDWWQPELFVQNTKHLLPPELEILADPPPEDQNYNCFLYVLGLHTNEEVLDETNGFIYDSFVKHLLTTGDLVITETPEDGDYIVYQDLVNYPNALTHIGVLQDNKVVSKWAWGPLVEHDVWDVPAEYGNDVFYVKAITCQKAKDLFDNFKDKNIKPSRYIYHGTTKQNLEVIKPFKRYTPGGENVANSIPARIYATYNPAYAVAHSFPWSSNDGVDIVIKNDIVTVMVPRDKKEVLNQAVCVYSLPNDAFSFTTEEDMGLTYHSTEEVVPTDSKYFESVTKAIEHFGGKIELI